jgi:hypothetical protein
MLKAPPSAAKKTLIIPKKSPIFAAKFGNIKAFTNLRPSDLLSLVSCSDS